MSQETLDGKCAHMHIGDCNAMTMTPCNICLDCGEHNVKGGLGSKYLQSNSMEKAVYDMEKRDKKRLNTKEDDNLL